MPDANTPSMNPAEGEPDLAARLSTLVPDAPAISCERVAFAAGFERARRSAARWRNAAGLLALGMAASIATRVVPAPERAGQPLVRAGAGSEGEPRGLDAEAASIEVVDLVALANEIGEPRSVPSAGVERLEFYIGVPRVAPWPNEFGG